MEIEYTPQLWRNIGKLAKQMYKRSKETSKSFGRNKTAKDYSRRVCRLLGVNATSFEVFHPKSGEMRAIIFTPQDWHNADVNIYTEHLKFN